jgi:hypothetical protein
MNRRKQFRAVATRFDKLAVHYQATTTIADIFTWLGANPTNADAIRETEPPRVGSVGRSGVRVTALIVRYRDVYEPRKASSHAWTTVWTSTTVPTTNTVAGSSVTSAVFVMRAIKRPSNPSTEARMMSKPNRVGPESFTAQW